MWGGKEVEFDLKKVSYTCAEIQNGNKKERYMFRSYVFRVGHLKITPVFNRQLGYTLQWEEKDQTEDSTVGKVVEKLQI